MTSPPGAGVDAQGTPAGGGSGKARQRRRERWLAAAVVLPVVVLAGKAIWHERARRTGTLVDVPVRGIDPRDLLSGHYLRFRLDFGPGVTCPERGEALVCLRPKRELAMGRQPPRRCELYIRGRCTAAGVFATGMERHYVPETQAKALERAVLDGRASLRIRVRPDGSASPVTLLVDGRPWSSVLGGSAGPGPRER